MNDETLAAIGFAAGDIYQFLAENGETTLTRLAKEIDHPNRRIDQALGWLARENKVQFIQVKRSTRVGLA
jgi:hypothetical protein